MLKHVFRRGDGWSYFKYCKIYYIVFYCIGYYKQFESVYKFFAFSYRDHKILHIVIRNPGIPKSLILTTVIKQTSVTSNITS